MTSRTVYGVLREAAKSWGPNGALFQPYYDDSKCKRYRSYSWNEYLQAAEEIAAGLRSLGFGPGDIIAIHSETRAEFYLADLGILTNGSVSAALYTNSLTPDLLQTMRSADSRALFVENIKDLEQFRSAPVEKIFLLTGESEGILSLDDIRKLGRQALDSDPGLLDRILASYSATSDAILYLTSGATGSPKMVMVTHSALVSNVDMGPKVVDLGPDDRTVAWLPAAHIAQRVAIELLPIRCGAPVYFAESLMKLPQDIKQVRPTFFLAPPRMWERVYTSLCAEINKRPKYIRTLFYMALGMALGGARYRQQGKPVPVHLRASLALFDRLLFRKIRDRFGGQLRIPVSGAAPLGKDLASFYDAIGMPLVEGFGLTEGGIVCLNPTDRPKAGSIGKALPGATLRVAEDGELLIESPTLFSRYYKDPEATRGVLQEGVLFTGDLATIDAEGFVYITGRKKEMIVSSTGKKVYPSRVEGMFKMEPLINNVLLVGDRLPYVTALLTINPAIAETLNGVTRGTLQELTKVPSVTDEVKRAVKRVNKQLAPYEQIRKYRILDREFTIEAGEITPTMKLRKARIVENFRSEIEALYAGHEDSL